MEGKDAVEFEKCAKDFFHFAENHIKIRDYKADVFPKSNSFKPFKTQSFHRDLFTLYETERFVITKKFRQGGFTTFNAIYALWKCMFDLDKKILLVAKTDREAISIQHIIKNAIENLPEWMKPQLGINNHHEKEFLDTGGKIWCMSPIAARSRAVDYLFIEEAAFISNMEEHWNAVYPVIATGGKCFVSSTINGTGNWFHKTWESAVNNLNKFVTFSPDYGEHIDFQNQKWVDQIKKNLGETKFKQEFECIFYDVKSKEFVDIKPNQKETKVMEDLDFNIRTKEQLEKSNNHKQYKCEEKLLIERWDKVGMLQNLHNPRKGFTAVMMENQCLLNERMSDTGDVAQFKRISIPLVYRIASAMKCLDLVAVQPSLRPVSMMYIGQSNNLKEVEVVCNTKKFKAVWCYEQLQDLRSQHNIDQEKELTAVLAEQIAMEQDRAVIFDIFKGAAVKKTIEFQNLLGTPDQRVKTAELQFSNTIRELHDLYGKPTCNWIVIAPELKLILKIKENKQQACCFSSSLAVNEVGIWKMDDENELKVFVDPLMYPGSAVMGYKGEEPSDSGYLLSTYVPLMQTPVVLDPDSFNPRKGLLTREFAKLVDPTYYATFTLNGIVI